MSFYEKHVLKFLAALLVESRRQTFLQSKAVRLLSQIAGNTEPTRRVPTGFHLSVSEPQLERN